MFALLVCSALWGCTGSGTRTPQADPYATPQAVSQPAGNPTVEDYGSVVLRTDAAGRWLQLTAVGTAPIDADSPRSVDVAVGRARAQAYEQIAKFLGNHVQTRSDTRSLAHGDAVEQRSEARIRESAASLLRGVTFDQVRLEGDRVTVRAVATPVSVDAAGQVKRSMLASQVQ
jgi:hypothetical protein